MGGVIENRRLLCTRHGSGRRKNVSELLRLLAVVWTVGCRRRPKAAIARDHGVQMQTDALYRRQILVRAASAGRFHHRRPVGLHALAAVRL